MTNNSTRQKLGAALYALLQDRQLSEINVADITGLCGLSRKTFYYYYQHNKPCYYGAVYEYLTDDHTCEGAIGLAAASEVEFEDDGHAIAWAMAQ